MGHSTGRQNYAGIIHINKKTQARINLSKHRDKKVNMERLRDDQWDFTLRLRLGMNNCVYQKPSMKSKFI